MFPFEELDNTTSKTTYLSNAHEIMTVGWKRRNFPIVPLDQPIPWALNNDEARSWNYYLHCLDMLDGLLRAHSHTQDKKYLACALPVALDWIGRHSDPAKAKEISPFSWYDMAVGMRAYRLAYLLEAGKAANLVSDAAEKQIWASLLQHCAYLADDANIAFHTNHGYYQVAGQMAMARRFADIAPEMQAALEQGRARLRVILDRQFAPDGVHLEHSPDYHRMVYDTLKAIIDTKLVQDPDIIQRAEGIEKALAWFVLPNQSIANFGDSDYRSMYRTPQEARQKWRTPAMRYAASGGSTGAAPEETFRAFTTGGYYVARVQRGDFEQASYLAQITGFHSRTHKHADDLSFIWSDRGADILVDAGRYGYIGKTTEDSDLWNDGHWYDDPYRVYCESTRAHNTLEFDGINYARKKVKAYGAADMRWAQDASGLIVMESACKHFRSIRRARVLVFMPAQWLLVYDWFHDNNKQPHQVRQWFHTAPGLAPQQSGGGEYIIPFPACPQPLRAASLFAGPVSSPVVSGQTAPELQGWWSGKEREAVANGAFCYSMDNVFTGTFATLFAFSDRLAPDIAWSQSAASGRKMRFRWQDDQGRHELHIERPAAGDLQVRYSEA